ncbi:MAG TPA: BlaI/MecI/CopY family transcriptional regulator [Longimicrobiales bacterium]|nr:BlaI/MecI/CopY family transcriptional regulator [Longimicrobiales bacterium]
MTDLQLAVMRAVWDVGPATLAELHADLSRERELAPTTVGTLLSRLRKQQLVSATRRGRQLVYSANVSEWEVRGTLLRRLMARLFGGDSVALVQHLLASDSIGKEDVQRIRALIGEAGGRRK